MFSCFFTLFILHDDKFTLMFRSSLTRLPPLTVSLICSSVKHFTPLWWCVSVCMWSDRLLLFLSEEKANCINFLGDILISTVRAVLQLHTSPIVDLRRSSVCQPAYVGNPLPFCTCVKVSLFFLRLL